MKFSEPSSAERELSLLRSAIDVAGDVVLVYRVDPQTRELVLAYMNDAYTRQTGYTREDALGRTLEELRQAMPDDPGMAHLRDAIEGGEPELMQIVSYRKDGSTFWNQVAVHPIRGAAGAITHWVSVERDVTEAVTREDKLEDQQARLLMLTSIARRLFSALDPHTLVARLEEAARDLMGASVTLYAVFPDGRAARTSQLRVPDEPQDFGDTLIERAATSRGYVSDAQGLRAAAGVNGAGHTAYVIEAQPLDGGTLRGADLFMLDLLAEYFGVAVRNASLVAELEDGRSAILELHQVKSDLIAMLAHDFKGPLTSIVGFTELAMELGEVNADQLEYLESVRRLALRLADLATDTLAFSHLERNEIDLVCADVDVAAVAREVADTFKDEREVRVFAHAPVVAYVDARRVRQVLQNLIENAIKYSTNEEPVDVEVRGENGYASVAVTDRGIGVPKKELGEIFGRFSRGSNVRKQKIPGTGFGLYIARQIAEMHGGSLTATSTEGKGSTFTLELPVGTPQTPDQPLCVVVLDTEREARSFIAHALREAGLRVHVEHSVADLQAWTAREHVDSLVIDVDDVPLSRDQVGQLEEESKRCGFTIVAVGISGTNLFEGAVELSKPFLVQDVLGALRAIRSRPA